MKHGIDVSNHQGVIDWPRVSRAEIDFAYIKATEGERFVDAFYERNRAAARHAGILTGAYHFARPSYDPGSAERQALRFLTVAEPRAGDLLPALDLEQAGGLGRRDLGLWALRFVETIEEHANVTPVVYTYPAFAGSFQAPELARCPLWVAHYTRTSEPLIPRPWSRWHVWQGADDGHVPGIGGPVDTNVASAANLEEIVIRFRTEPRRPVPLPGPRVKPRWFWEALREHLRRRDRKAAA